MNKRINIPEDTRNILELKSFSFEQWRESFLNIVLRGAVVVSAFLIFFAYRSSTTDPTTLYIFIAFFVGILFITFAPVTYTIRAISLLTTIYALGTFILLNWGWNADASVFLAGFCILTGLLFEYRQGIFSIILSVATVLLVGWQTTRGDLVLLASPFGPGNLENWLSYSLDLLAVSAIANLAIYYLKREFNTLLKRIRIAISALNAERTSLEERVQERTTELADRSAQLESSAFVARQAAAIQDLGTLMDEVVQLITNRFGYYHTGIFLVDESGRYVTLQSASSEGGKKMLQRGHQLEVGRQGVVGYSAYEKRPRIALDVGAEAVFFNNPDLPDTRSEIALPLIVRNRLIGVLDIQSKEQQDFSQADISTFQSMADQVALAIENARLITESQLVIKQLESLTSEVSIQAWKDFLGKTTKGYSYTPLGTIPLTQSKIQKGEPDADDGLQIPITLRGKKLGSLTLKRKSTDSAWSIREQSLVQDVATQIGLALENARLLEESQKRALQEQSINEISSKLSQALDIDTLLQTAVRELHQLPSVAEVSVYLESASGKQTSQSSDRK